MRKSNAIHKLIDGNKECLEEAGKLRDHIVEHFAGMLGTKVGTAKLDMQILENGPRVSQAAGTRLLRPVTRVEIKGALWSIADKKAPDPDGFSSSFYKQAWPIIGDTICDAVSKFFRTSCLLKQINATALVLLPKKANPQTIKEYCPLACCNVLVKVII